LDDSDPRMLLARRLRALREEHWPGRKITQAQLAQALGGLSTPLISSWESTSNPPVPPLGRLDAYALLFATPRSFDINPPRPLRPADLDDDERSLMDELMAELRGLRNSALRAGARVTGEDVPVTAPTIQSPWRFKADDEVFIVCAELPPQMLEKVPYTDVDDPDYIELLRYSDLDALVELYGHVRATNPQSKVRHRVARRSIGLPEDDLQSHLAVLGGRDWNYLTQTLMEEELDLPVRQVANWEIEGEQFFEVEDDEAVSKHRPVLKQENDKKIITQDVALFARATNPYNRETTVTVCCGMYGRGTYGAIRALTDDRFRVRNARYIASRFGDSEAYCILTRVQVRKGVTLTPDWTSRDDRLFEWSR
jgi:transcriptional regulator with XRE-family HTH domain